ncbi:hypothetical protein [Salmonella enterica]|uniref:hypothetical protein n=1 Tax=Salmonella enterica TaxID=28901 RepID=UPI002350F37A|nr:hypothetical protein [Salmonella enterica]MDC7964690.1 hypothetical protein [Salmonella enterica subsp. enterica serovar 4,[5],12:i:-]
MQKRVITFTLRVMQVTQCAVLIGTQDIFQVCLNIVRRLIVIVSPGSSNCFSLLNSSFSLPADFGFFAMPSLHSVEAAGKGFITL